MLQTLQPPFRRDSFQAHSDGLQGFCRGTKLSFESTAPSGAVQGPDAAGARYALVGVVEHQGTTLSNGHYVAFVQRGLSLPACSAVAAALQQHCPPAEPALAGSNGSSQSTAAAAADAEGGVSSSSQSTGAAAESGTLSSSSQSSGAAAGRGGGTSAGASDGHRRKRSRSPAGSSSMGRSSDAAPGVGGAKAGLAGGNAEAPRSGSGKAEAASSSSGGSAAEASQGSASPAEPEGKDAASAKPSGTALRTARPNLVKDEMPPDDWEAKAVADGLEDDVKPPRGSVEVSDAPAGEAGPAAASPENDTCSSSETPIPSASKPLCDSEPVENARQEFDPHATSAPLENGQSPSPDAHSHSEPETHPLPERTDGSKISNGLQSGPPAWYCISDTQVKSVSAADVMACEAYLLLYTRSN